MNYILFDGPFRQALLPFTYTRPVAELRVGGLTIKQKWERSLKDTVLVHTQDYLTRLFPLDKAQDNIWINAGVLPSKVLIEVLKALEIDQALYHGDVLVAYRSANYKEDSQDQLTSIMFSGGDLNFIQNTWDIFAHNPREIANDISLLKNDAPSEALPDSVQAIAPEHIYVAKGAQMTFCTMNASEGPIYIGKNVTIMEGAMLRGPLFIAEGAVVKMGAKLYGGTTIGTYCKVGGEISNSMLMGYSNKGHDGYLGNSVIGFWCNLGANTNTSNLKNNYDPVRLWDYKTGLFAQTGLEFCGLMMGDHSKSAIGTMFNTGSVVGVSANIFGSGFPRNFIPSFSWGGAAGLTTYGLEKACLTAQRVMSRRSIDWTDHDQALFLSLFEQTKVYRKD